MNQHQLDRALARATGESVKTIRQRGFSLVPLPRSKPIEIPLQGMPNARPEIASRR